MNRKFDLKSPLKKIYLMVTIGVVIAIGNYFVSQHEGLLHLIIIHVFTAFTMGFGLTIIIYNKHIFYGNIPLYQEVILLSVTFVAVGILASELENILRYAIRNLPEYIPFGTLELHITNAVIAIILGFVFYYISSKAESKGIAETSNITQSGKTKKIFKIPARIADETVLIEPSEIVYIEAYDNYSTIYTTRGNKLLCDYTLGYLESVLSTDFIRIHRKHIANKHRIVSVKKYTKGRFLIKLDHSVGTTLSSSASYSEKIKTLLKI